MSRPPTVSVLMTCYNLGRYLEEAVDSVLAQTYTDFEILIVDDGSTDTETCRLLETFARPKTRVFRTPNQGLARARNFLAARAEGRYLSALDADDLFHSTFLERTVQVLEADSRIAFVSTHLRMFGDEEGTWPRHARCDPATLLSEDTIITPALVRREALTAVGGYDERMPHQGDEDWDLWISLVNAGFPGVILPDILFSYRRRRGSMCDVCTSKDVHLGFYAYLLNKHGTAVRNNLLEILLQKEERTGEVRRDNVRQEAALTHLVSIRDAKAARLAGSVRSSSRHGSTSGEPASPSSSRMRFGARTLRWRRSVRP